MQVMMPPEHGAIVPARQVPLWQQLQAASGLLMAVRSGQSLTKTLQGVDASLRPGAQALSFHALRWLGRAEALRQQLAKKPPPPEADALLCVVLALIWREKDAPYAPHTLVDQAVEAAKRDVATAHQASFINGCLRRFLRERDALVARTDANPQAVWNHPQWWVDQLRKDHPEHWQAILRANNAKAPLVLRINTLKTTVDQYIRALAAIDIVAFAVGEYGVMLAQAQSVPLLPGYADGLFSVQDAAAQLAAPLLLADLLTDSLTDLLTDVSATDSGPLNLLDACAAPGGKTAHLLELLGAASSASGPRSESSKSGAATVTAIDIDAQRCKTVTSNLARLGLVANVLVGDAAQPSNWWDGRLFDGILLDAPCTASGIVRRHPDVRWLRRPSDIVQLASTQAALLNTLWPLLKPGGYLVYCTCSVFKAEGVSQAQTFLANHSDAVLMASPGHLLPQSSPLGADFPDNLLREHDGFYYARFKKLPA